MTTRVEETQREPLFFQAQRNDEKGAEHTDSKIKNVAAKIFSLLIFPFVGLARLLKQGLHYLAGLAIIPSQMMRAPQLVDWRQRLTADYQAQPISFKTADDCVLDGMHIPGKEGKGFAKQTAPTIIYFNGNNQFYESHGYCYSSKEDPSIKIPATPLKTWIEAGYNVLVFNYRGVGQSTGRASREGLILDGEAVYQYANEKLKVAEEDILLWGQSFGGAVATEVAANHPHVQLCNTRSFSSLKKEVSHLPYFRLLSWLVPLIGWDSSITDRWLQVKGKKIIAYHPQDKVIPYQASLVAALEKREKGAVIALATGEKAIQEGLEAYGDLEKGESKEKLKKLLKHVYRNPHERRLTPLEIDQLMAHFKDKNLNLK